MAETYTRVNPFDAEAEAASNLPLTDVDLLGQVEEPVDTLADMGLALLEIVKSAAVSKGSVLPARQSVYMAPIPADCEQVGVLFSGWNITPSATEGTMVCRSFRWMANFSVIITRCTPAMPPNKGKPVVPVDKMIEAAQIASDDAEVLMAAVNRLGEIGGDLSLVTNPPQGGFQTVELNIQLLSTGSI